MSIPILLDCDPGHDDAIALLLALASPEVELLGVTTLAGNQTLDKTTANAIRVLELAGRGEVPVAAGADRPLVRAAELVVVNGYELEALPETPKLTALTLGEEGAVLLEDGKEVARAESPRVQAVDGTAAGDAFTACLVVSRLEGRAWEEGLRRACAAGAIAASRAGAQPSLPSSTDIDEILSL